jgi:hypothetical protein
VFRSSKLPVVGYGWSKKRNGKGFAREAFEVVAVGVSDRVSRTEQVQARVLKG